MAKVPLKNSSVLEHFPQAENPNMPLGGLWGQIHREGWRYVPGDDLIAVYMVHSSLSKTRKSKILHQYTEGIHYFTMENDIHRYAKEHLRWTGMPYLTVEPPPQCNKKRKKSKTDRCNAFPDLAKWHGINRGDIPHVGDAAVNTLVCFVFETLWLIFRYQSYLFCLAFMQNKWITTAYPLVLFVKLYQTWPMNTCEWWRNQWTSVQLRNACPPM